MAAQVKEGYSNKAPIKTYINEPDSDQSQQVINQYVPVADNINKNLYHLRGQLVSQLQIPTPNKKYPER
jgi:hypothetical protein